MKSFKINNYLVKMILIIVFILLSACDNSLQMQMQPINTNDFKKITEKIDLYNEENKGVGFLIDELRASGVDYYGTFHSLETLNYLGYSTGNDNLPLIDTNKLYFKDLSDIYYYVEIFHNKLKFDSKQTRRIKKEILNYQDKDNTFNFDSEFKQENNYLSTYMGLRIMSKVNEDINNYKIKEWIYKCLELENNKKVKTDEDLFIKASNIKLLSDIAKLVKVDVTKYIKNSEILEELQKKINDTLENNEGIDIQIIETFSELYNNIYGEFLSVYSEYLLSLQNDDGGFAFSNNQESDSLATYIAVKMLNSYSINVPRKSNIVKILNRFRLANGYYVTPGKINTNFIDTYYSFNILTMINREKYSKQIKQFLVDNYSRNNTNPYYLDMLSENNLVEVGRNFKNDVVVVFENYLSNCIQTGKSTPCNMDVLMMLLKSIKKYDISISEFNKERLKTLLTKENENMQINNTIYQFYIADFLKEDSFIRKEQTINQLDRHLRNVLDLKNDSSIKEVFSILKFYEDFNLTIDVTTKEGLKNFLYFYHIGEGVFRMKSEAESFASFESTYYGIWLYQRYLWNGI
ncbi:hypothetical protein C173_20666 [Paenibacillus sp. FSL R7-277]|uniref:prenyltransferase/squalene oxidase repeat-containing protein n=1 Tax=Paenibacillus sp. FSL R7-277 TaxID=1227352 RepID=UPI0003E1D1A4|nr:hypothetical protein [Paenibacillus sp. FSL R7-277]ETT65477.1 hypothetical protein C173_20666 [Paenibacillus sp. FSL R7-277]